MAAREPDRPQAGQAGPAVSPAQPASLLMGWREPGKVLRGIVVLVVTALVFVLIFRRIDVGAVLSALADVSPGACIGAGAISIGLVFLAAARWRFVLGRLGYRVAWLRCAAIIFGTFPVNCITPSHAGDVLKMLGLRTTVPMATTAGGVLAERCFDLVVLAALAAVGAALAGAPGVLAVALAILAALVCVIAGLLLLRPRIADNKAGGLWEKLARAGVAWRQIVRQPAGVLAILAFTAAHWLSTTLLAWLLFWGVGADVTVTQVLSALPVAIFVGLLPLTLNGMGTRDAALVYLMAGGASEAQVLAVGLMYTFFVYWLLGLIGLPFLRRAAGI